MAESSVSPLFFSSYLDTVTEGVCLPAEYDDAGDARCEGVRCGVARIGEPCIDGREERRSCGWRRRLKGGGGRVEAEVEDGEHRDDVAMTIGRH